MTFTFEDEADGAVTVRRKPSQPVEHMHPDGEYVTRFQSRDEAMDFHNSLMHFISHPPMKRTA